MRAFTGLSVITLLAASSCEKARDLVKKVGETSPAAATSAEAAASISEIDGASYESFTQTPGVLAVVEFGADWCPVCKTMEPLLAQVAGEFADKAIVGKIDFDRSKVFAKSENVSSLPEIRFYRDGKQVEQIIGGVDAEALRQIFKKHVPAREAQKTEGAPAAPAAPTGPPISRMKKDWLPPGMEKR